MDVKTAPFTNVIIQNFLNSDDLSKLQDTIASLPFSEKESDLFHFHQSPSLNGDDAPDIIKKIKQQLLGEDLLVQLEQAAGITITRNKIDLHATIYKDTNFLLPHDDQLDERIFAFLIYLSDMDEGEGGELLLYDHAEGAPTNIAQTIRPKINLFAGFVVSEISFHEVAEVIGNKDRIAFGGWYYGHQ